jgi:nicotinamide-nucleotide amidase
MSSIEIIAIGTELLLGEIQDTNTRYIAQKMRAINLDLFRSTVIGDNATRISELIKEALTRSDIIITSGGLGPTVDDPTRLAVANAIGTELVFLPELWDQIIERFKRHGRVGVPSDNNRRQAYIPQGAIPLENAVGTAPAFIAEVGQKCIVSLPGVPRELEYLMENKVIPYLIEHYRLTGIIKVLVVHTAGLGESLVDERVADLELLSNPTVGLLAHPGQTDVRITAKAESEAEAKVMIENILNQVKERLGESIFGYDLDTLEKVLVDKLQSKGLHLRIIERGFATLPAERYKNNLLSVASLDTLNNEPIEFETYINQQPRSDNEIILGIDYRNPTQWPELFVFVSAPNLKKNIKRSYGGPIPTAPLWAVSTALDYLRRCLLELK